MHKATENLAYTNRYFYSRLAESELKYLNQMKRVESIQVETNNNEMFQLESVKETCVIEPKNIRSVVKTSEKLLEDYLWDLVKSLVFNKQQNLIDQDNKLKVLLTSVMNQFKTNENNYQTQKLLHDN
jgi:hypothetical protein